jgi:hypothetical protein
MPLNVRASLSYANVADVEVTRLNGKPCVAFAASAHGGTERLWFCFRIANGKALQKTRGPVMLLLKHCESMLGGGRPENIQPVIRYEQGEWQRLDPGKPAPTEDGRLGAWWQIDAPDIYADIAVCYPYGMPELNRLLHELGGRYRADAIGLSQGDRHIMRLSNDLGQPGGRRPGVYCIARQHAGETPASWVLDGLLRHLAELGDRVPLIWTAPLADIDGIEQGDYGKTHASADMYYAWSGDHLRHEAAVLRRDIARWADRCSPTLILDLHAPSLCDTSGVFAFVGDQADDEQSQWVNTLRHALGEDAADKFARVLTGPWPDARQVLQEQAGCPAVTLEVPYARIGQSVLTIERYREIGARLASAIAEQIH